MADKTCSKCGKAFHCGNEQKGCWCENYSIPIDSLKQLYLEYNNCLCEDCLMEYAQNKLKNIAG